MKNIFLYLSVAAATILVSCEADPVVYDNVNGKTAVSFASTNVSTSVPDTDLAYEIPVNVTTVSDQDRTFNAVVVSADNASEITVGSAVIPAGEYNGNLIVNFDFSAITGADGTLKEAVISLVAPAGGNTFDDTVTISYFRDIVCNDPVLTINTDSYANETGFFITNSSGTVVFNIPQGSFPGGAAASFRQQYVINVPTLPDGTYTATITDAYADGQADGTVVGNYTLTCSIITLAQGGGSFGASQDRTFEINP